MSDNRILSSGKHPTGNRAIKVGTKTISNDQNIDFYNCSTINMSPVVSHLYIIMNNPKLRKIENTNIKAIQSSINILHQYKINHSKQQPVEFRGNFRRVI